MSERPCSEPQLHVGGVNASFGFFARFMFNNVCQEVGTPSRQAVNFLYYFWGDFLEIDLCDRSPPGLSPLDCWHDMQKTPLQDGDHPENNPA